MSVEVRVANLSDRSAAGIVKQALSGDTRPPLCLQKVIKVNADFGISSKCESLFAAWLLWELNHSVCKSLRLA